MCQSEDLKRDTKDQQLADWKAKNVNPDCEGDCNGTGIVNGEPCPDCADYCHRDKLRGV